MAKKAETKSPAEPMKVRQQTDEEIRKRLKHQGKIKDAPKQKDDGVHQVTQEEALLRIEERKERHEEELTEEDPNVRPFTKKDVLLRQTAEKEREKNKEDGKGKTSRVQTEEDIKARNNPDEDEDKDEEPTEPVEIYAKDIVSFKDDDGELITGKVKNVTSKGEAVIDTEDAVYTVPVADVTKEEK